jgi:hypothetical protein
MKSRMRQSKGLGGDLCRNFVRAENQKDPDRLSAIRVSEWWARQGSNL